MPTDDHADLARQVLLLRPLLLRLAHVLLANPVWAEDAVSEAIAAAFEQPGTFRDKRHLRGWLVGVVKRKVADQYRLCRRDAMAPASVADARLEDWLQAGGGRLPERPADWGHPEQSLQRLEFFERVETCLGQLPSRQGQAFLMHGWLDLPADEICESMGIQRKNLWVLLHRARTRLRHCVLANDSESCLSRGR